MTRLTTGTTLTPKVVEATQSFFTIKGMEKYHFPVGNIKGLLISALINASGKAGDTDNYQTYSGPVFATCAKTFIEENGKEVIKMDYLKENIIKLRNLCNAILESIESEDIK